MRPQLIFPNRLSSSGRSEQREAGSCRAVGQ